MAASTEEISCLECGKVVRSMAGHITVHKMSLNEYRAKHTQDGTGEDVPCGWSVAVARQAKALAVSTAAAQVEQGEQPTDAAPDRTPKHLSAEEKAIFRARYNTLFYQADEDPSLEATVANIVVNEIQITRYQEKIGKLTGAVGFKAADAAMIKAIAGIVKDLQGSNMQMMTSLSLTRAQKQKDKKVIESTPARLVASFEAYMRNMSPEGLRRHNQEMEEAAARMRRNLAELKLSVPQDAIVKENVKAEDIINDADGAEV